jgi:urease accessory protein
VTSHVSWRILQLADSGFPTGGFAHSAGLEAAVHRGQVRSVTDLVAYADAFLWNLGNAALPFVGAAHDTPDAIWALDEWVDAFLTSHVGNRASRTQGRAFVATCVRVFEEPRLVALAGPTRAREVTAHFAPIFGASLVALGLDRDETLRLYLYLGLRGLTSAAIRLGVIGPHEAQRLQTGAGPTLDAVLSSCALLGPEDAAVTAPIIDIVASTHDTLYARIFQS